MNSTTIFRREWHEFSIFRGSQEWHLYLSHSTQHWIRIVGKIKSGKLETIEDRSPSLRWHGKEFYEKALRLWELEKCSYLCNNDDMRIYEQKVTRNREVVNLRRKGLTFQRIAEILKLKAKSTVAHIYKRDKDKY